jgi:ribose transport system substrate-binding protein
VTKYLLGFANSDETIEFAANIRRGLEKAVTVHPEFELISRDNASDTTKTLAHIDEFAHLPVDLAIIYHLDESMALSLVSPLKEKQIPVISVEHPIPMTTFLGLDDASLGRMAAEEVGRWVQKNWNGQIDKVVALIDPRRFGGHLKRFSAAISTLKRYARFNDDQVLYLDSSSQPAVAGERFGRLLDTWIAYHHLVVMTAGDLTAVAVLNAARAVNRESDLAVLSGNGLQPAIDEFQKPFSRLLVSPAVYPERYGEYLIDLARRLLKGEPVPSVNWIEPVVLSRENWNAANPTSQR